MYRDGKPDVYTLYLKGNYNVTDEEMYFDLDVYTLYLKGNYNNMELGKIVKVMFILFI